ncbi:hypothetical protein C8R44DRAFT_352324 [Mycena epipterygia]|nr:hypothetical protein C8R44DRAFT_352324 [Mycena epipterygia]
MAKFALTAAYITSLLDPINVAGDWTAFLAAIDPDVEWMIGSETKDSARLTGVYNLASWLEEFTGPMLSRLNGAPKFTVDSFDSIGNKAIVEISGEGTQMNGKPYSNRIAWFLIYSEETGKIVKIREYLNTALIYEVIHTNP